jgi:glycosyltransferase involved in cell wall biosynthesis
LPCLVSDIPANKEWVADGVNGWTFRDGNADALAASILQVYEQRDTLSRISQAAHHTAEEKADWNKNFQKLLETYQKVCLNNTYSESL